LLSILRNALYLVSVRGLTILARAAYIVILARFLGPEMYGLFAYGTSWYLAFLPLTFLGLEIIAGYEVGRRSNRTRQLITDTLILRVVATVVVAILCAFIGLAVEQESLPRALLIVFSVALLGRSLALWADGVFVAHEVARKAFNVNLIFRPAEVVLGFAVLLAGGGVLAVTLAHAFAWWAHALVSTMMAIRVNGGIETGPGSRARILTLLAIGLPLGLVDVTEAWLLNGPIVTFRLGGGTEAELGQLSLVLQALMVSTALGTVIAKAALPVVARSVSRGDDKDRMFAEEMLRLSAWLGLGAWLLGTAWGDVLVGAVFGVGYAATGELLGPVMALFYPFVASFTLAHVLMARKEGWRLVLISFLAAAVMTGIQSSAQQAIGLDGVLLAMVTGFFVWLLGLAGLLFKLGSLGLRRAFAEPWALIAVVCTVYYGLLPTGTVTAFSAALSLMLVVGALALRRRINQFKASPAGS